MFTRHSLKIAIISLVASLAGFSSVPAQRHGTEPIVTTGSPAGLIKKIEPEYPIGFVIHGVKGRGRFRLTINAKSGLVDEVIVKGSPTGDLVAKLKSLAGRSSARARFGS